MIKNYFKKNGFGGADKVPAQKITSLFKLGDYICNVWNISI
jgi:hypothetical protein